MIHSLIVAGGGTGGHLFPGLAVVDELRRRNPSVNVLFVGTERGIERRVLPQRGERLALMQVRPLMGRTPAELTRSLLLLPAALARASRILSQHKPDLVVGVGGYAAGPMLLAAAAHRIPSALMEQNAYVGLTNRMLAKTVGRAYLSFESTAKLFGSEKARVVGNPVRRSFVEAALLAACDPRGFEARARRVFVLGGSQGARALNEHVPRALAGAGLRERGVGVLHQTGVRELDAVRQRYRELKLEAEVVPFIDDMVRAYASSRIVISRAGASVGAELCAIGRPSILVPYPHAAEDHQSTNARALQDAGAAIALDEQELAKPTPTPLAAAVRELLQDPARCARMSEAARRVGHPDAAAAIVDDMLEWLGAESEYSLEQSQPASVRPLAVLPGGPSAAPAAGARRRAKVRRGELRLQVVDPSLDVAS